MLDKYTIYCLYLSVQVLGVAKLFISAAVNMLQLSLFSNRYLSHLLDLDYFSLRGRVADY